MQNNQVVFIIPFNNILQDKTWTLRTEINVLKCADLFLEARKDALVQGLHKKS